MSASDMVATRQQTSPQALIKARRPKSNWLGKLLTHLANIYGKLGAKSRTEAVSRASNLGLLPL